MSLAGSVVSGLAGGSSGYERAQLVTNGGFASGTGWTITGSAWTIAGGVATNTGNAGTLKQTLVTSGVLRSGGAVSISVDVVQALEGALVISAYRNGTNVQDFYSAVPATGTLIISTTAEAEWDTIVFVGETLGFASSTLDNISITA